MTYDLYEQQDNHFTTIVDFVTSLARQTEVLNKIAKNGETFSFALSLSGTKGEIYKHKKGCDCGWTHKPVKA